MTNDDDSREYNVRPVYRPDIDGLRAIAILSVVIFHAFPKTIQGGFVGVDIFFVISGFLISSIIFRSMHHGNFSYVGFYIHRIKRIFPALALVLLVAYLFGWFALLPEEFKQLGKHIAAGAGFVQNFALWQEAGYFDTASELKPLMHLWSLAIEEQFYLIYPLLIWIIWRSKLNIFPVVTILLATSFYLNIADIHSDIAKTFFVPQTRFWELLAGSILAYIHLFKHNLLQYWIKRLIFHPFIFRNSLRDNWHDTVLNHFLSILGLTLFIFAIFVVNREKLFPGWWALLPVFGAFLLILAGPNTWINRTILANRPMVFVGLISYPLYLWHWPIFSYLQIIESGAPSTATRIAAVVASFIFAWITYIFLEKPIRFGPRENAKAIVLVLAIAIIGLLGFYTYEQNGFPSRINQAMSDEELTAQRGRYWGESNTMGIPFSKDKTNIIVFGDSQAHDILHALRNDKEIGLKFFSSDYTCSGFFSTDAGFEDARGDECKLSFSMLLNSNELKQADVLIYAQDWNPGAEIEENYSKGIEEIRKVNKNIKIYFFGSKQRLHPIGSINVITKDAPNLWDMNNFINSKVSKENSDEYADKLAELNHVIFVSVKDIFCIDGCIYYQAGKFLYFDWNHWTQTGANQFFEKFSKTDIYNSMRRYKAHDSQ